MSKGIASKNSLKALAYPIQEFINSWGAGSAHPTKRQDGQSAFPAPYELAALRGEAVLRERFFTALIKKIPVSLDANQQIALWRDLVEEGGKVTDWVQRLGIAKALRREAALPLHSNQEARKLYCILLDVLNEQAPQLLPWAVEGYFWHCWKSQFPSEAAVSDKKNTQIAILKERLLRQLRHKYNEKVDIKESFKTVEIESDSVVQFSILEKRQSVGIWAELISITRPRIKIARLVAYEAALEREILPLPPIPT